MFGVIKSIPRGASRLQLTAKKGHNFYKGNSIICRCFLLNAVFIFVAS